MKTLIAAVALLALASPAFAAGMTATPAQWKDIHTLYGAFEGCKGLIAHPDELLLKETQ